MKPQESAKPSSKIKVKRFIFWAIPILFIIGLGFLIRWVALKGTKKEPEKAYASVCLELKDEYNTLYAKYDRYNTEETVGQDALDEYDVLIDKIVDKDGIDEDPSCLYMVSELYAKKRDYPGALLFITKVESLTKKYPDRPIIKGLSNQLSVEDLKSYLEYRFLEIKERPNE